MKLKKHTENQNTENEEQKLKEDTERMRMHYGMLLDHHIIDFDMFVNNVGKENVPEILQEYNKILMKGELAEYEPDFIGICRHHKVDCELQCSCIGLTCNHEHKHSNAKMCYMNKQGGELETFLLKNNTSVPKLLEMERAIAETKQETSKVPPITSYCECTHKQTEPNLEYEQKNRYTTYNLTRQEEGGQKIKPCPHFQFNIGCVHCRTCRYFVSHDHVYRTVKCSYPNPVPDIFLEHFKNNNQFIAYPNCGKETPAKSHEKAEINYGMDVYYIANMQRQIDTYKAALLHISERITHGNKCNMVVLEPIDETDRAFINKIIEFIDEHQEKC